MCGVYIVDFNSVHNQKHHSETIDVLVGKLDLLRTSHLLLASWA